MAKLTHAVWLEPRSRKWVTSFRNYLIGAVAVVALLAAASFVLFRSGNDAYNGFALAAVVLGVMAACLGPFMRYHLEDTSVMPRVLELYKGREGSHPVKIKVTVDGVEIGRDYGVVEFDGATLKYTGLRTSFNFARTSATVVNWSTIPNDTELHFSQTEGEDLVLAISSISRIDPDNYYSLSPAFRNALKTWLLSDVSSTQSEVLPPNRLRFKSDFRPSYDQYAVLGLILWFAFAGTEKLSAQREPYQYLAYVLPPLAAFLAIAYYLNRRRHNKLVIEKYSLNNASLSQ